MRPWFKVSSERPEKLGINLATPGLVVLGVVHYIDTTPLSAWIFKFEYYKVQQMSGLTSQSNLSML